MVPADGGSNYVYCAECGLKASADWSYCRSCEASLADATPADERLIVRNDGEDVDLTEYVDSDGCPKCGYTEAEVQAVAATDDGVGRVLGVENRRFKAASCTRCGYTEFYKGRKRSEVLKLFKG